MADPIDYLTAIGSGFVGGKAERKRENELIQLEQKEANIDRKERRRADLMGALSRFASSGLFDMDTIIGAMQDIPAAVQSEVGERMLFGGLEPRTELSPSEKLRAYEAETARYKAQYPKPETELEKQEKLADIEKTKAQTAYYKQNEAYRKRQANLVEKAENAKTEKQQLEYLKQLEKSYSTHLNRIDRMLEDSFELDDEVVADLIAERKGITESLSSVRSKLSSGAGLKDKNTEELTNEDLMKMLDKLE